MTGGEPLFPPTDKTRKARWINKRTCVLPVRLEQVVLSRRHQFDQLPEFQSGQGVPAPPSAIYFATKGADKEIAERVKVPKIVKFEPANGDEAADTQLQEIRVTFDMPMAEGMSWTGGGEEFPKPIKGKKAFWSDEQKDVHAPRGVGAGSSYRLGINSQSHINFQSQWGVPVAPVEYKFKTK